MSSEFTPPATVDHDGTRVLRQPEDAILPNFVWEYAYSALSVRFYSLNSAIPIPRLVQSRAFLKLVDPYGAYNLFLDRAEGDEELDKSTLAWSSELQFFDPSQPWLGSIPNLVGDADRPLWPCPPALQFFPGSRSMDEMLALPIERLAFPEEDEDGRELDYGIDPNIEDALSSAFRKLYNMARTLWDQDRRSSMPRVMRFHGSFEHMVGDSSIDIGRRWSRNSRRILSLVGYVCWLKETQIELFSALGAFDRLYLSELGLVDVGWAKKGYLFDVSGENELGNRNDEMMELLAKHSSAGVYYALDVEKLADQRLHPWVDLDEQATTQTVLRSELPAKWGHLGYGSPQEISVPLAQRLASRSYLTEAGLEDLPDNKLRAAVGRSAQRLHRLFQDVDCFENFDENRELVYLQFDNPDDEVRMRLWRLEYSHGVLDWAELIARALQSCLPMRLSYSARAFVEYKARADLDALAARKAVYLMDGWRETFLSRPSDDDGWRLTGLKYRESVEGLLRREYAGPFVWFGGLTARLAMHYGGQSVLDKALRGPSETAYGHRQLYSNVDGLYWEMPTEDEQNVLHGAVGVNMENFLYLWPPPGFFEEGKYWLGSWSDANETWFQSRVLAIEKGTAPIFTAAQWRTHLKPTGILVDVLAYAAERFKLVCELRSNSIFRNGEASLSGLSIDNYIRRAG